MNEYKLKYFIQYWACTNAEILTIDNLREALYKIWCEIYDKVPDYLENKLFIVGDLYKKRIIKGDNKWNLNIKTNIQHTLKH